MITFDIPIKDNQSGSQKETFSFSLPNRCLLLAGSRNLALPLDFCKDVIYGYRRLGFSYYVGCANGVDKSFRKALARSPFQDHCFVACAFEKRTHPLYSYGLYASLVVPENLHPVAALVRRTIWMVKRCETVLLFPDNPRKNYQWGKGSRLVFRSALFHLKPVFVVTENPPKESVHYRVLESNLFGVVDGYWVVPHPVAEGGTCDEI